MTRILFLVFLSLTRISVSSFILDSFNADAPPCSVNQNNEPITCETPLDTATRHVEVSFLPTTSPTCQIDVFIGDNRLRINPSNVSCPVRFRLQWDQLNFLISLKI